MGEETHNQRHIAARCPICSSGLLHVTRLSCPDCKSQIETDLTLPRLLRLPPDLLEFMLTFVRCRGNIREVEKMLAISYPTVCKRLDLLNELLGHAPTGERPAAPVSKAVVIERLEKGEISPTEAVALLRAY